MTAYHKALVLIGVVVVIAGTAWLLPGFREALYAVGFAVLILYALVQTVFG